MRALPACLLCLALGAGAGEATPTLPPAADKLVEEAVATTGKARQAYDQAVAKEQARLVAALQKELEKETRKGNLDGALAIKQLITEVELGLVRTRAESSTGDLLGDGKATKAQPATTASPAELATDCPLPSGDVRGAESAPAELADLLTRCVALRLPREDRNRYQFIATAPGTVLIQARAWRADQLAPELQQAGFQRLADTGAEYGWFVRTMRANERFALVAGDGWVQVIAGRIKQVR